MNKIVGKISSEVIETFKLDIKENTLIFIGESNIEHIKQNHLEDYKKYGRDIENIIKNPTYVARNEKKNSIEYIKEYILNEEHVLVVVKATGNEKYFIRTMYIMDDIKVEKYRKYGYFKRLKK